MKAAPKAIPRKWSWHYAQLMRRREALLRESGEHSAASRESLERGGMDEVDVANDKCEHNNLMAEISQEHAELAEVEAAIARIHQGTYGICEVTGEPISTERLRALPWTRLSQAAASKREPPKSAPPGR